MWTLPHGRQGVPAPCPARPVSHGVPVSRGVLGQLRGAGQPRVPVSRGVLGQPRGAGAALARAPRPVRA